MTDEHAARTAAGLDANADEKPIEDTLHLFIGKTVAAMDASCCNKIEFLFTDGSAVALHIDCDWHGMPSVDTCTHCATELRP